MQFQSDMARTSVEVPNLQELSGMGRSLCGWHLRRLYDPDRVYEHVRRRVYSPAMDEGRGRALQGLAGRGASGADARLKGILRV